MKLKLLILTSLLLLVIAVYAQEATQTVRGTLRDNDSKSPLIGATVTIVGSDPLIGAVTDVDGNFRVEHVPIGRIALHVSQIGYEPKVIPNILVTSAKEVVLNLPMQESVESIAAVEVSAKKHKSEVLNEMALVSARSFSVEETQRYAGAFNDPARMASSFAGVTSNAEGDNDIVVRGNSPKGILWRLEGVEIPNPNHFGSEGATGGPISALNSNMLDNSDFYTGAFPPEYGNALSGVFDIRFKKGNNERREYTASAGVLGIDFTAEGPFSKGGNGSYIANYRYSSLQLLSDAGIVDFGGIPKYQDASFNVNMPINKNNVISVFGLGGLSSISSDHEENDEVLTRSKFSSDFGVVGASHMLFINDRSFVKNSLTASASRMKYEDDLPNGEGDFYNVDNADITKVTYRAASAYNYKINAKNKLETGIILSRLQYDALVNSYDFVHRRMEEQFTDDGSTHTLQGYSSWKYRMSDKLTMVSGLHYLYFALNGSQSLEPRLGLRWEAAPKHALTAGLGIHSRLEGTSIYLAKQQLADGSYIQPNKELEPTKAAHFVLGYEYLLNTNTHLKVETYYQHLYDVPIENMPNSTFALLNSTEGIVNRSLVNDGTGRNYGVELTLERYYHNDFYYMTTLSLYESLYTPQDGIERGTAFNGNYVANFLAGKEFKLGAAEKNRVLFVNTKVGLIGGSRYTEIDLEASRALGTQVRNEAQPFAEKGDDIFFLNFSIGTRKNKGNTTRELKLDINNATNQQGIVNQYYESTTGKIIESPQLGFLPNIIYTYKF